MVAKCGLISTLMDSISIIAHSIQMARPSQHVSRRAAATPQYYQDQIFHGVRLSKSEQPIQTATSRNLSARAAMPLQGG